MSTNMNTNTSTPDTSRWPEGAAPVTIPPARNGATKSWAKHVSIVLPSAAEGHRSMGNAIQGTFLERGGVYALREGVLIVTYDLTVQGSTLALHQVTRADDGTLTLTEVKTWTSRRGIIGPQMIKGLGSALKRASDRPGLGAAVQEITISVPLRPNTRPGRCYRCQADVAPGEGHLERAGDRTVVLHNDCPERNARTERCADCGQDVPAGTGIIVEREALFGPPVRRTVHGECPPRPAPGVRRNAKPGTCTECLQNVPAGAGILTGGRGNWKVQHDGACPPHEHNPNGWPLWRHYSSDAPYATGVFAPRPGTVFRATVHTRIPDQPEVPADAPGLRMDGGRASFIAVAVASMSERQFVPDDEEWHTVGETLFRVATPEEAAPVLAEEAKAARRRELAERTERLLAVHTHAPDDCEQPDEVDPSVLEGLPRLPIRLKSDFPPPHETWAWVDWARGIIWTAVFNGLDGDNWSRNNWGSRIVRWHPLTPERRQLVEDLIQEYNAPEPLAAELRVPAEAIERLLSAGWTPDQIRQAARLFRITEPGDAEALAARTPDQWREAGWWDTTWPRRIFPPADAARLADAGISFGRAVQIGGTAEEILAARPPEVPAGATRILLRTRPDAPSMSPVYTQPVATDDPQLMARHLQSSPGLWRRYYIEADTGPRPVHVTKRWQLWDDDKITVMPWLPSIDNPREMPKSLPQAGEQLLDMLICSSGGIDIIRQDKPRWLGIARAAERIDVDEVASEGDEQFRSGWSVTLRRVTVHLADRPDTVTLWRIETAAWAFVDDGDAEETASVFTSESEARAAYQAAIRS